MKPHLSLRRLLRGRASDPADTAPLDALLDTGTPDVAAEWQQVAEALRAAAAPAAPSELAAEAAAITAFRRAHLGVQPATRRRSARPLPLSTLLTGRIAAALACAAVGIGGATSAAFADVLPAPIQNFAHATIGAPHSHAGSAPTGSAAVAAAAAASARASAIAAPSKSPEPSKTTHAGTRATPRPTTTRTPRPTNTPTAGDRRVLDLCRAYETALADGLQTHDRSGGAIGKLAGSSEKARILAFCATAKQRAEGRRARPSATSTRHDGNPFGGNPFASPSGDQRSKGGHSPAGQPITGIDTGGQSGHGGQQNGSQQGGPSGGHH